MGAECIMDLLARIDLTNCLTIASLNNETSNNVRQKL
jgi:hypothetical protein